MTKQEEIKEGEVHKSVLCRLAIAGSPDDGMMPVYTGCTDGFGRPVVAVINEKNIKQVVDNGN